ncbi:MAG: MFS transporter [Firmicutes bacterium]|nr:MFS transporter [Bacillota bacterium]
MKLKFRTKLSYGIGGLADNALFTLIETFLLFFLTTVAGVEPATAGTILAVGCLWEAFCGPISGFLSDNIETRYGKRKPFLLAAAIPTAVVTTLLFTNIEMDYTAKVIYYGVMTLLFWWCFAVFFVPYITWGSELTEDYNERTVLRSYAYVFNQVGKGLGTVMPTILVGIMMGAGISLSRSWSTVGLIVGVASGAALLICALTIKESDNPNFVKDPNKEKVLTLHNIKHMFLSYFSIIKLRPIRYLIGASLLYLIANTVFMSDMVYFYTYNMGMSALAISGVTLFMTVFGIVLTPLVAKVSEKTDKKTAFIIGLVMTGAVQIVGRFFPIDASWSIWVMGTFFTIGNTCYWQLMPSMIYDVCDADELASGKKRSGEVVSLQALSESVSAAAGVQLLGIILQAAGFSDTVAVQSDLALTWINNSYSWIPGLCTLVVAVILMRYPINRKNYEHILEGVEKRRRGEEVNMEEYRDIF